MENDYRPELIRSIVILHFAANQLHISFFLNVTLLSAEQVRKRLHPLNGVVYAQHGHELMG